MGEIDLDARRHRFPATLGPAGCGEAATGEGVQVTAILDGTARSFVMTPDQEIEGEAEMTLNYALEPWELKENFVLTCQTRPKTKKTDSRFRPRLTCAAFRDTARAHAAGIPKTSTKVKVLGPRKPACRCRLTGRIQAKPTVPVLSRLFG